MVEERLDAVEAVIREETDSLATARLQDAFALHARKTAETNAYFTGLAALKQNAVALARFQPSALDRLKSRQGAFQSTIEANLKMLQTLSKASEHLIRSLAQEVEAPRQLAVYDKTGMPGYRSAKKTTAPIVISRKS